MAIPIIHDWKKYFHNPHEGLGSSYERIILNELLLRVTARYDIQSALESPSFGFTGVSGINLTALAKQGVSISLEDHDPLRLSMIANLWSDLHLPLQNKLNNAYSKMDYPDNSFDLGYNFSALWFTDNLDLFLGEFCRVCRKAILICVPNRDGIGYKMQIKDYNPVKYPYLHPGHIDPLSIKYLMQKKGWNLIAENYIDCPPWPDIGMSKELFLGKLLGKEVAVDEITEETEPTDKQVSILPYYRDADPDFATRMLRYAFVERLAPKLFKRYWAHHYYLLFVPGGDSGKV